MNKELILDMWVSGYSLDYICEYTKQNEKNIKSFIKEELKEVEFEDVEEIKKLYTQYNFSRDFFINVVEKELVYFNYLEIFENKGSQLQLSLLNNEIYAANVIEYLNSNDFPNINDLKKVKSTILKKYNKGKILTSEEYIELPIIEEEKFVYFFTTYNIRKKLFLEIFKISNNAYSFLCNKYTKGTEDFEDFVNENPDSSYSIRYGLSSRISFINSFDNKKQSKVKETIKSKLTSLFIIEEEEIKNAKIELVENNNSIVEKNSVKPKKDIVLEIFQNQDKKPLENSENNIEEVTKKEVNKELILLHSQLSKEIGHKNENSKSINMDSLKRLKEAHEQSRSKTPIDVQKNIIKVSNKELYDIKNTRFKQLFGYVQENVKPRFDVKKVVK